MKTGLILGIDVKKSILNIFLKTAMIYLTFDHDNFFIGCFVLKCQEAKFIDNFSCCVWTCVKLIRKYESALHPFFWQFPPCSLRRTIFSKKYLWNKLLTYWIHDVNPNFIIILSFILILGAIKHFAKIYKRGLKTYFCKYLEKKLFWAKILPGSWISSKKASILYIWIFI